MSNLSTALVTREYPCVRLSESEKDYLKDLYGNVPGYVKVISGKDHNPGHMELVKAKYPYVDDNPDAKIKYTFLSSRCLQTAEGITAACNLAGFSERNLKITTASFKSKEHASEDNIAAVFMLTVDCDFVGKYTGMDATDVADILVEKIRAANRRNEVRDLTNWTPLPQYIECSHRLRLVYKLDKPIYIGKCTGKKRLSMITLLKRILKCLNERINAVDADFGVDRDGNKLTNYLRVPGSANIKYELIKSKREGRLVCTPKYSYAVSVKCITGIMAAKGDSYSLDKLIQMLLPPKGDWYNPEAYRKRCSGKKVVSLTDNMDLMDKRKRLLRELRDSGQYESRELLGFLYWNCLLTEGKPLEQIEEETYVFCSQFEQPLTLKEVKTDCKAHHVFKYKESTFREKLGLDYEEGYSTEDKKEYNRKYYEKKKEELIKKEKTKKQRMSKEREKVYQMRDKGLKIKEIADKLKVSTRKIKGILGERSMSESGSQNNTI